MVMARSGGIFDSSIVPIRLVFVMWLAFSIEFFYRMDLSILGILPRTGSGLIGILTAPMIHANPTHLISNSVPLLFLGSVLFFFYPKIGGTVFYRCYFITNILVWLFSPRVSYHIGASGLVYGLSAFLIFFGFLRGQVWSLIISILIFMMYGGIFYGVLPTDPWISCESHLAGAVVGALSAFDLRSKSAN